jgi:hypothetical protein
VSFYVSTAIYFLFHCDEWDRFVAPPRHKFVTGATLLQLVQSVCQNWVRLFCLFKNLPWGSFGVYYWYTASKIWIINWHNIINIPESKIKGFSFYIFLSLIDVLETLSHRSKEKIGKERCKVFPYRDVDDLLNN